MASLPTPEVNDELPTNNDISDADPFLSPYQQNESQSIDLVCVDSNNSMNMATNKVSSTKHTTKKGTSTKITSYSDDDPTEECKHVRVDNCKHYGVSVHHNNDVEHVLSQYCVPVGTSITHLPLLCKYGKRECVVYKTQLLVSGKNIPKLSQTTFSPEESFLHKYGYNINDTRMLKCFNPECIDKKTNRDKIFHHICFKHSFKKKENNGMKLLTIKDVNDDILGLVKREDELTVLIQKLLLTNKKLVLPVCSKRCYNSIETYLVKSEKSKSKRMKKAVESCQPTNSNWDKDGVEGISKCSGRVLIEWLTAEENASAYFGGSDKDGRTSSTRKETYHNLISKLIKEENGSIRTPESIRNKISRLIETFHKAFERMEGTGRGTKGVEHANFQNYVVTNICRYYFELLPVSKDRPNMKPWYTNHDKKTSTQVNSEEDHDNEEFGVCDVSDSEESTSDFLKTVNVPKQMNNVTQSSSSSDCEVLDKSSTSSSKENHSDKLSPLQAKELKRNVFMSRDRQINAKKRRGKGTSDIGLEDEDKEFMLEQRKLKMKFDLDCHNDLKKQHLDMMKLEKEKLDLQKQEMNIRMDNEKNKKTLSNIEIFKARLEFKRQDPSIDDEFLDQYFSLDK